MNEVKDEKKEEGWMGVRGWLYVSGLALFFLLYGLFMFYMIGDKGPPGWDFGRVEDIPGESVYSTNQPITGRMSAPEPQHVSRRPSRADIDVEKEKP